MSDTHLPSQNKSASLSLESNIGVLEAGLSEAAVKQFAEDWFDKLNRHVPAEEIEPMISDGPLDMEFPGTTIRDRSAFHAWYADVGKTFGPQDHHVERLDVTTTDEGATVEVTVVWKAQRRDDESWITARATQTWSLTPSAREGKPVITSYIVRTFEPIEPPKASGTTLIIFSHVGLACKDIQSTEDFYTKYFSFHRTRRLGSGDDRVVFLKMEYSPVMLELFTAKGESPEPPATGVGPEYVSVRHLAFQVDDVDAKLAEIGDAAPVTQPPLDFGEFIPGWRTAWIADPDGRILEISQGYSDSSDEGSFEN